MKFFTIFFTLSILANSYFVKAESFIPAKLINNHNTLNKTQSATRLEGWAYVSYVIDIDGKVSDIDIIDISDKEYFTARTKKYFEKLEFSPATDGQGSIASGQTLLLRLTKEGIGIGRYAVTPGFYTRYEQASELLSQQRFAEVEKLLTDMSSDNAKNLQEQALLYWIQGRYYYAQKEWDNYGQSIERAGYLHTDLPPSLASKTLQNLYRWHLYKNQFFNAGQAIKAMTQLENVEISEQSMDFLQQPINESLSSDKEFKLQQTMLKGQSWVYQPLKLNFTISMNAEQIGEIALRCANRVNDLTLSDVVKVTLAPSDKNCVVLIKAKDAAVINITEHP